MNEQSRPSSYESSQRYDQLKFLQQSTRLEESNAPALVHGTTFILSAFLVLFITWMAITQLQEIAQAPGDIVPKGLTQVVQHFDGGMVKDIRVQEGATVREGDVLLTIDGVGIQEELNRAVIEEKSLQKNLGITRESFAIQKTLEEKGASSHVRYLDAKKALTEAESALNQQHQVKQRLQDKVERLEVRAPVDGIIKSVRVNTLGEVVKPGDVLMEIVPTSKGFVADVRINPSDIGHVEIGQPVKIKISSYDFGRYGGVDGTLEFISATTFTDERDQKYYRGRVSFRDTHLARHPELAILPGMVVQAGIFTGKKSVLSYLFKPIQRAFNQALDER